MKRGSAAVGVALLVLAGCASYHLVRQGAVNKTEAARIEHRLIAIRGLKFLKPVPIEAVSAADARAIMDRELRHQFEPGELAELGRIYGMLGLFPPDTDLEHAVLDLYEQQAAGFYDPVGRRMILIEDQLTSDLLTRIVQGVLRRDFTGELVLAHELTHALQDQHFGIDFGRSNLGEDDAELARHAVYEGDATLAGFAVVLGKLQPRTAVSLAGKLERVPGELARAYPEIPAVVRETVVFQYVAGVNFVSWAYQRAGWDGVNALLVRPPASTEQILHPEKYFVHPEYPVAVRVGAYAPFLQSGWRLVEDATLGELTIRLLAERFFARDRAAEIAAGWEGDRLIALARDADQALIWLTVWDSERDAAEFFAAETEILAAQHPGVHPARSETTVVVQGAEPYYLERQGTKVLAMQGTLDDDLADLAVHVWRRSTYETVMPPLPLDLAAVPSVVAAGRRGSRD